MKAIIANNSASSAPAGGVSGSRPLAAPAQKRLRAPEPVTEREVTFELCRPGAQAVFVAGTFNGWDRTPLTKVSTDEWTLQLMLRPGTYEYRFIVDDCWIDDPLAQDWVPNPFGGVNALVTVEK